MQLLPETNVYWNFPKRKTIKPSDTVCLVLKSPTNREATMPAFKRRLASRNRDARDFCLGMIYCHLASKVYSLLTSFTLQCLKNPGFEQ